MGDNDSIPGIGLGATPQVMKWARLGRMYEKQMRLAKPDIVGRPTVGEFNKDASRAFGMWQIAQMLKKLGYKRISNRALIRFLAKFEEHYRVPMRSRKFPQKSGGSYEQSISRGKRALGIDKDWYSERCNEINTKVRESLPDGSFDKAQAILLQKVKAIKLD